jgi:hypothetical protein
MITPDDSRELARIFNLIGNGLTSADKDALLDAALAADSIAKMPAPLKAKLVAAALRGKTQEEFLALDEAAQRALLGPSDVGGDGDEEEDEDEDEPEPVAKTARRYYP